MMYNYIARSDLWLTQMRHFSDDGTPDLSQRIYVKREKQELLELLYDLLNAGIATEMITTMPYLTGLYSLNPVEENNRVIS